MRVEIEIIQDATDRAARLTHQLLAFSRKQILEPRLVDLNAVVTGIEPLLRRMIGEDIDVFMTLEARLAAVKADPGQIEQVLLNLAVNARDAMPEGGRLTIGTSTVSANEALMGGVSGLESGRHIVLTVTDTGHGMDAAIQARIFEPFFTTKEAGKGTGLGLATVYGVVKQSGGHVTVCSEPGRGTTFTIYLPMARERIRSVRAGTLAPSTPHGSETVLLAEDDETLRALAREILTLQGYSVLEARGAEEALQIAEEWNGPIQLLLTDVVMPRMNGRHLAELLLVRRPDLKVLFMSGYVDSAIVRHGARHALPPEAVHARRTQPQATRGPRVLVLRRAADALTPSPRCALPPALEEPVNRRRAIRAVGRWHGRRGRRGRHHGWRGRGRSWRDRCRSGWCRHDGRRSRRGRRRDHGRRRYWNRRGRLGLGHS
jgi:two-component system, cell cycle sensor histidine kinase and response regulator CckA